MAVGHHRRRDGTGWRRLDVLVDNLPIDALAVAFAVRYVDVIVLVDVVAGLIDRACVGVDVPVCAVGRAIHALIDRAVARVRIDVPVRVVGRAGRRILVNRRYSPRVDVLVDVRVGVYVRIGGRASRCAVVGIGVVRCAVGRRVVDV